MPIRTIYFRPVSPFILQVGQQMLAELLYHPTEIISIFVKMADIVIYQAMRAVLLHRYHRPICPLPTTPEYCVIQQASTYMSTIQQLIFIILATMVRPLQPLHYRVILR